MRQHAGKSEQRQVEAPKEGDEVGKIMQRPVHSKSMKEGAKPSPKVTVAVKRNREELSVSAGHKGKFAG